MKQLFAALLALMVVVGCERSGPTDSGSSTTTALSQSTGQFSEVSMYKMAVKLSVDVDPVESAVQAYDSLQNNAMLDSLKVYLALTDEQFASLQLAGTTLFTALRDIKTHVDAGTVTHDSALTLVKAARDQFVVSVKAILTAEQLVKFNQWLTLCWNKVPRKPRGPKGPFCPDSLKIRPDTLKHPFLPDSLNHPFLPDSLRKPFCPDSLKKPFMPDTTRRPGGHGKPGNPGGPRHP